MSLDFSKQGVLVEDEQEMNFSAGGVDVSGIAGQDPTIAKTILDQGLQGATFGFADELTDRMGALIASPFVEQDYSELLAMARQMSQSDMLRQQQERPFLSGASQFGGAIVAPAAALKAVSPMLAGAKAAPSVSQAMGMLSNVTRGGRAAEAVLKTGIGVGGAEAGRRLYESGTAQPGEKFDELVEPDFSAWSLLGGVAPAIKGTGAVLKSTKKLPGAKEVKKAASEAYKKATKAGGILKPEAANRFLDRMLKSVEGENVRANKIAKKGPIKDLMEDIFDEYADKPMTLDDLEALDKKLGEEASRYFSKVDGAKPEYGKIKDIQSALRQSVTEALDDINLVEGGKEGFLALKEGTNLYSAAKKIEDIEDIVNKAQSQQQPARAMRRGFARLANNKGFGRFTPEEQELIKIAADESVADEVMKAATSRLTSIIGYGSGNPAIGVAAQAGGFGLRALENQGMMGRAGDIQGAIINRAGLPSMPNPVYQRPASKVFREGAQIGAITGMLGGQ